MVQPASSFSPTSGRAASLGPKILAEGGPSVLPTTPEGGALNPRPHSRTGGRDAYVSAICVGCGDYLTHDHAVPCPSCGRPFPSRLEIAA